MHITAIIPAKRRSERLPNKNLSSFGEGTLITHKIEQLRHCRHIDTVVVASDDHGILKTAEARGAIGVHRDAEYCDEKNCSLAKRWRHIIRGMRTDLIVWTHCTNPLVTTFMYDQAIEAYRKHSADGRFDSLASVTRIRRHAWVGGSPLNFRPNADQHEFAADLAPIEFQDGAIFIQPHAQMMDNGYFYGECPYLFEIPQPWGLDIDHQADLDMARILHAAGIEDWGAA